jgi:3-oxoacyl-[acyl-carrier protein] reductase
VPSELGGVALVTGGGRGIGRGIALELAGAGMRVAVSARTRSEVEAVAEEIGGLPIEGDVSRHEDVERMIAETESELGPIDLLVTNAGIALWEKTAWELAPEEWWHVLEVNVLGAYLCCRGVIPGMIERGRGRIVLTGSGAAYLPSSTSTAYSSSKAALWRFGNTLAEQLRPHRIPVFVMAPGLVKTEMTADSFSADAPWTPPELAPRLVREMASGRLDTLTGRYLHAEHDADLEDLARRADDIVASDLNAIRLRR